MFGDQGAEMLKILKEGSTGLKAMRQEAKELGHTLDDSTIDSAIAFQETLQKLRKAWGSFAKTMLKAILPGLTALAEKAAEVGRTIAPYFSLVLEQTSALRSAFIALGVVLGVLAVKAAVAFAPILLAGGIIAALAIAIDDVWTAFEGGASITGRVFASLKGYISSFRSWLEGAVGRIWNYVPLRLRENLQEAYGLLVRFSSGVLAFFQTFWTRLFVGMADGWGAACIQIKEVFGSLKEFCAGFFKGLFSTAVGHIDSIVEAVRTAVRFIGGLVSDAIPDFLKKGFSAAVEYVGGVGEKYDRKASQAHLAPSSVSTPHIQNHSNQSVNVSVNVKSGANAHEIGGEVSKAVRRELEKERINAFMGFSHA